MSEAHCLSPAQSHLRAILCEDLERSATQLCNVERVELCGVTNKSGGVELLIAIAVGMMRDELGFCSTTQRNRQLGNSRG